MSIEIRHEWKAPGGDDLAIVIEADGAVRLLCEEIPVGDWTDQQPGAWPHALLVLAADLLRERERAKEAIEALKRPRGLPYGPSSDSLRIFELGFNEAKAAALALIGGSE